MSMLKPQELEQIKAMAKMLGMNAEKLNPEDLKGIKKFIQ